MSRTRILIATLAAATGIAAGIALRPDPSTAGPDRIAFPASYRDGVLYTVADRYDVKQYRELFANREAVQAAREGKPLPDGSVLTLIQYKAQVDAQGNPLKDTQGRFLKGDLLGFAVMEKRQGWGAEYPEAIRNGDWEYSAFTADGKFNDKANSSVLPVPQPHTAGFRLSYPAMAGRTRSSTPPRRGLRQRHHRGLSVCAAGSPSTRASRCWTTPTTRLIVTRWWAPSSRPTSRRASARRSTSRTRGLQLSLRPHPKMGQPR